MKKVLIVDDSEVLIRTLQKGFKKYQAHFQPIYAQDGLEAMNFLDEHSIDLVLTDIQMPMIDGLVLLAFIQERYPAMPCIVMTAYGDEELKELVGKDILHFIHKPIHAESLAQTIISELSSEKKSTIDRVAIRDLLNHIVEKRKTCVFKLISDEGLAGFFYFYQGDLYNAVCGKLKGKDAVSKMLTHENAKILFSRPPEHQGVKNVSIDSNELIQFAKSSRLSVSIKKTKRSYRIEGRDQTYPKDYDGNKCLR